MTRNQREKDLPSKQKGSTDGDYKVAPTSSRLWSGLKNPRIVRVSRAFGGKDRHSKVSTVRGLRDRRVRLSVPTAIQLYDLQDRLGLNQPSKVVDWLLNAAQHEINKLPPLQLPPEGNFMQFSQSHEPPPPQAPYHSLPTKSCGYTNEHDPHLMSSSSDRANGKGLTTTFSQSTHWNADAPQRSEPREDAKEPLREKGNSTIKGNGLVSAQVLSHEILQRRNHSSVSGILRNTMPYASYYQWEAANAYLSQLGMLASQSDQAPVMSIPSSRSLAIESQIVFCPPGIMPSMFPSNIATPMDFNARQFDQMQKANSISQTPQSNLEINSLHLSSPSARPFQ